MAFEQLAVTAVRQCVLFVALAVRFHSISSTFPTRSESVHAGISIVKLLSGLQLISAQPDSET
jgi:hypothetical protein